MGAHPWICLHRVQWEAVSTDLELMEGSQVLAGLDQLQRLGDHQGRGGNYPKGLGHLVQEGNLGLEGSLGPEEASPEVEGMACYQSLVHP